MGKQWKQWDTLLFWASKSLQMVTAAMKLRYLLLGRKSYDQPRQRIKKQRHCFANKGPSSQSYGFSSSHVWMWELDYKESWALKNLCFWTVVLENTLESPLDYKKIKPVHLKGNQSWIFIGRTGAEAETPILCPPDVKNRLIGKDPDAGKDWRWEEKGMTEDEKVGWHHQHDGHELNKFQELVMNREAWKQSMAPQCQTWLGNWNELNVYVFMLLSQLILPSSSHTVSTSLPFWPHLTLIRASLGGQTVKNPPAMWKTRVQSLSWEDPLDDGMSTHSSVLSWRIPMEREAWLAIAHGVAKSWTWRKWLSTTQPQLSPKVLSLNAVTLGIQAFNIWIVARAWGLQDSVHNRRKRSLSKTPTWVLQPGEESICNVNIMAICSRS